MRSYPQPQKGDRIPNPRPRRSHPSSLNLEGRSLPLDEVRWLWRIQGISICQSWRIAAWTLVQSLGVSCPSRRSTRFFWRVANLWTLTTEASINPAVFHSFSWNQMRFDEFDWWFGRRSDRYPQYLKEPGQVVVLRSLYRRTEKIGARLRLENRLPWLNCVVDGICGRISIEKLLCG
jgi:hypothetical protein